MQRSPLAPSVDEHRAAPFDAPLAVHAGDRLGVVHERDGVRVVLEEHHLPAALHHPCVWRLLPVRVVERVRQRDLAPVRPDGGDPRLGMTGVRRAGPRP